MIQYLGSGYLSGQVPIFYGLGVLDKRYKVWYTAKLSAGATVWSFVMSKTGGEFKRDHNTPIGITRHKVFQIQGLSDTRFGRFWEKRFGIVMF